MADIDIIVEVCALCGSETPKARITAQKIIPLSDALEQRAFYENEARIAKEAIAPLLAERDAYKAKCEELVASVEKSAEAVMRFAGERNAARKDVDDLMAMVDNVTAQATANAQKWVAAQTRVEELEAELLKKIKEGG